MSKICKYFAPSFVFSVRNKSETLLRSLQEKSLLKNQYSTDFREQKINVDGININYVHAGEGDHVVLCLPGALGSIWTHFKPQIIGLNKSKLTIKAWDPPGYGRSRPPDRDFSPGFFQRDADFAAGLMRELGFKRYSLLGWSDGGTTAMILAGKQPKRVQKLVVWGANTYISEDDVKSIKRRRDSSKWSEQTKATLSSIYEEEYYIKIWDEWCDAVLKNYSVGGDLCQESLPKIECPTLIVHGGKDPLLAPEHVQYNLKHLQNSRLHVFENGKHSVHVKYSEEFNKLIEGFIVSDKV